jgi:hypothetical protein
MVFNATFNNISAISWRSVLLVEETGVPGENRPDASHWQTLSHNVVLSTPRMSGIWTHKSNKMNCELMLTYDTPALRKTGSRNLTGQKTLPTIWGTYMKLVTKYQISAINSCWEKCAYMFNVYKTQISRQTGSRNLTGPKTFPTIWHTYMKLVAKYQIPVINSCLEKCEKCAYTNVC